MGERRTKMVAYRVDLTCEKCDGLMEPDGMVLTTHPPMYPHTCTKCGWKHMGYETYSGRIAYEDAHDAD